MNCNNCATYVASFGKSFCYLALVDFGSEDYPDRLVNYKLILNEWFPFFRIFAIGFFINN